MLLDHGADPFITDNPIDPNKPDEKGKFAWLYATSREIFHILEKDMKEKIMEKKIKLGQAAKPSASASGNHGGKRKTHRRKHHRRRTHHK
jgi:hypothetical protein